MSLDPIDPSQYGFPPGSRLFDQLPSVRRDVIEASQRIKGPGAFLRFWEQVLSADEREELGNCMEDAYRQDSNPANHVVRLRGWEPEQAIIEIAFQLGFLAEAKFQWLLRQLGYQAGNIEVHRPELPNWDRRTGELTCKGRLLKKVKVERATSIVQILDEFQSVGWQRTITSPIDSSIDAQRIHHAVSNLRQRLKGIGFRVQGQTIVWFPCELPQDNDELSTS